MNLLSLLGIVLAAETIISPLASDYGKPTTSFADIGASKPVVLGVSYDQVTQMPVVAVPSPTPTTTTTPLPTKPPPSPTPTKATAGILKKSQVTIALLGDSMTDTLGPEVPELTASLQTYYPDLQTTILNYGVGATNIDYGIHRITNDYVYLGKQIPSLASQHPDMVILESFGYNPYPFDEGAINKHWIALAQAVDTLRQNIPGVKIVIAATIAPNANIFGDGAANLAFTYDEKWQKVNTIKQYLESTVQFAKSQHLPLADAYHPSLKSDGNGIIGYINAGDHIHTSPEGRTFFNKILAQAIVDNKLLEQ